MKSTWHRHERDRARVELAPASEGLLRPEPQANFRCYAALHHRPQESKKSSTELLTLGSENLATIDEVEKQQMTDGQLSTQRSEYNGLLVVLRVPLLRQAEIGSKTSIRRVSRSDWKVKGEPRICLPLAAKLLAALLSLRCRGSSQAAWPGSALPPAALVRTSEVFSLVGQVARNLIALEMSSAGSLSATPVFDQRFLILSKTAVASAKGIATQAALMVAMGCLNAWCRSMSKRHIRREKT